MGGDVRADRSPNTCSTIRSPSSRLKWLGSQNQVRSCCGASLAASSSTSVAEAFDEPIACQNQCGDASLQPGEQCDDGANAFFDGCASNCRSEDLLPAFVGTAQGGTVTATIAGVAVQITTTMGQSSSDVAAALAAAINASTALQALQVVAATQTNRVVVSGVLDSFSLDDAGFEPPGVPALGGAARALLALLMGGAAIRFSRRRSTR